MRTIGRVLAKLGWLLAGCVETVPLGTECPFGVPCLDAGLRAPPGDAGRDAEFALDAREPSLDGASPPDGEMAAETGAAATDASGVDAQADAGGPSWLDNGGFATVPEGFGALGYEPLDGLPLLGLSVTPWAACRVGFRVVASARSDRLPLEHDVFPTEGDSFVEADVLFGGRQGLRQTLREPLRAGTSYALALDLRGSVGDDVRLELWGAPANCATSVELAKTGRLPEQWQSMCLRFVAPSDVPQLVLAAVSGSLDSSAGRVFIDNVRVDPSCRP